MDFTRRISPTEFCKTCWTKEDLSVWAEWPAAPWVPETIIRNAKEDEPYKLNETLGKCELQCLDGHWYNGSSMNYKAQQPGQEHWYNGKSSIYRAQQPTQEKCIWYNCRNWDSHGLDINSELDRLDLDDREYYISASTAENPYSLGHKYPGGELIRISSRSRRAFKIRYKSREVKFAGKYSSKNFSKEIIY